MKFILFLFVLLSLLQTSMAQPSRGSYDQHIAFANSRTSGGFYYSSGSFIAPSRLELITGKIPVASDNYHTPPNSLKLDWTSNTGGDWQVSLNFQKPYGRTDFNGDILTMWVYSTDEINTTNCPLIYPVDANGASLSWVRLIRGNDKIPAGQWVKLRLPFREAFQQMMGGSDDLSFNSNKLARLVLVQGLDDGKPHTLYIDDIKVEKQPVEDLIAPRAPVGLIAKGYELHVSLSWQQPIERDVEHFIIYRLLDQKTYKAINIQQGDICRFEDFIGTVGTKATYKVSAVDDNGNESPLSVEASSNTRPLADDELLTMVQEGSFRYFWDAAHPNAGMTVEFTPGDPNLIASGASGMGIMSLVVGIERGFITRQQGVERMQKIVRFLGKADRFHGAWSHFIDGNTGKAIARFGKYDNGGDLVETAFLMQGMLVARQYFKGKNPAELEINDSLTSFWRTVEWDWYRKTSGSNFLYWHWSPTVGFHINHPLIGWNESLITYLQAIASPTHGVPASMYHTGWAGQSDTAIRYRQFWSRTTQGDHFTNGNTYYGIKLDVGEGNGSELFFTHFSFMGFDPRNKKDRYTNYFKNNRNIALIHHAYAIENPGGYIGYGDSCWGLSAGINTRGGRPLPSVDNGTITISAALGSFPFTPVESMKALKHYYRDLGGKAWGAYGFSDGFNLAQNWFDDVYVGLQQGPIVVMIENYRTGLIWKLFMANPEITPALGKIGFIKD